MSRSVGVDCKSHGAVPSTVPRMAGASSTKSHENEPVRNNKSLIPPLVSYDAYNHNGNDILQRTNGHVLAGGQTKPFMPRVHEMRTL